MRVPSVVLSIAGYDPSSGAGVTADIKTAAAHGCYAVTCITGLTVQSTQGVFGVQPQEPEWVSQTLSVLADDFDIAAVRLGMLGSRAVADSVATFLEKARLPHVVLDPVIRSSSGVALLDESGVEVIRKRLIPLADVITPNAAEAAMLAGIEPLDDDIAWDSALPHVRRIATRLRDLGAKAAVVTGGHFRPANDYLRYGDQGREQESVLPGERLESKSTHGTGCAFATALACQLAMGEQLPAAIRAAKDYVHRAIRSASPLGKGTGPLNLLPPTD